MRSNALPTPLVVALSIALIASSSAARAEADQSRPSPLTDADVRACTPSHQTRWRERTLREGKWRVRARVERHVPDQTAVELLVAVRDGRLLDPYGVLDSTSDGSASWRPTVVNPRRNAEVGAINSCVVPEGHAPRFRVKVGAPRSDEGWFLFLEVDGGVTILAYSWFIV
jgi:hypothetical protein